MGLSTTSKVNVTLKKLNGKAHTSNDKGLINESLASGITTSYSTIFGEQIPAEPNQSSYYDNQDADCNIEWKQGTFDQGGTWYNGLANAMGGMLGYQINNYGNNIATLHILDSDSFNTFNTPFNDFKATFVNFELPSSNANCCVIVTGILLIET